MKRRLSIAALCLFSAGAAWSLDAESQRLADRYLSILVGNPGQDTAFERLWKIYDETGETGVLVESARARFKEQPRLSARILLRANLRSEADTLLAESAAAGDPAAIETLASLREENGDFRGAAAYLEKAATLHQEPGVLLRLGAIWQKAGEPTKARAAWERAVALSPGDLGLRAKLAEACASAGDREMAIIHLRVVAENGSPTERFSAWEKISQDSEAEGRWEEAIGAQEALLKLMGPGHWKLPTARQRLIRLHENAGTLAVLEQKWKTEAESRPRDPEPCLRLADLNEFQADSAQRLLWLRRASSLLPKDLTLAREVASLEMAEGHFSEAVIIYDRLLERQPGQADLVFLRAEATALNGNEAEAEQRVEKFVSAHSDDANIAARAEEFFRRMRLTRALERSLVKKFSSHKNEEAVVAALARFYLDEAGFDQAVATLQQFDGSRLSAAERAAVASRFSDQLRDGGLPEAAETFSRQAFEFEPGDAQYAAALIESLSFLGRTEESEQLLHQIGEVERGNLPREDLDRRLFLLLQARKGAWPLGNSNDAVRKFIDSLDALARKGGTENDWLRLARWQRWAGRDENTLRDAVQTLPQSAALREALAVQWAESGNVAASIEAYGRLAEMLPERSLEIQRRVGHLELDRGGFDEALRIFGTIQKDNPKDWKSAADLALAQQMAGNWFEAVEVWKRAYALAPVDARRGLRQPFLNATIRLQMYGQALDFFETASAEEKDVSARNQLLQEAAAYASENRVAGEWRTRLQRKKTADPNAEMWTTGQAFLLKAEGKEVESARLLASLSQGSVDSAENIEKLLKSAEGAGNWREAARLAGRLAALRKTSDVTLSLRQAEFFELARMMPEAEQAWASIAARYARNPEALAAAAEFFGRIGDDNRWEKLYRAAARLGGGASQVSLRLGMLALERGDKALALDDFENVLHTTRPDLPLYKDALPLPELLRDRVAASIGGPAVPSLFQARLPSEEDVEGCRLMAIQQAAQLLAQSPAKPQWLASFSPGVERIWARYFSGETDSAFSEMEELLENEGKASSREQVFAALLMTQGEGLRLGKWASADLEKSGKRWDDTLAAFSLMLEAGWKPTPEFFEPLFSTAPALRQWDICRQLAQHSHLPLACELGEKIPGLLPASQASTAWLVLAQWYLNLIEPDAAIRALDHALAAATPETTYTSSFFEALRGRWLLTPEEERAAFSLKVTENLTDAPRAMALALLASLEGRNEVASSEIARIFQPPLDGQITDWRQMVIEGGARLEEWRLPRLARDLYRNDRDRDAALLALKGDGSRRLSETMLILSQLGSADSQEIPYFLNEWIARGASDEELMQAFLRLQAVGQGDAAAAVHTRLCERAPRNEIVAGALLNALVQPRYRKAGFPYFEKLLTDQYAGTRRAMMQNAGLRMAQILEQQGEMDRALVLLGQLRRDDTVNRTLLLQHVDAMIRAGKHREALTELESSAAFVSSMPGFALPAARLYAGLGREAEAVAVLSREMQNATSPDRIAAAWQLRNLSMELGDRSRQTDAETLLTSLGQNLPKPPPSSETDWETLQRGLDQPRLTPSQRFKAGVDFLTGNAALPEPLVQREIERLRRISMRHPALRPEFYVLRKVLATERGTSAQLESQLISEWNGGRGGSFPGEILLQMMFEQGQSAKAAALLDGYLTDSHFNADAWEAVGNRFLEAGRPADALRVFSESARRTGLNAKILLLRAEARQKNGMTAEARTDLAAVERIAALDRGRCLDLARYYLAVDQPENAVKWLDQAPADARTAGYRVAAAKVFARQGHAALAGEELLKSRKFSETIPSDVVADYQKAKDSFETAEVNEFGLPQSQWKEVQLEVLRRLMADDQTERVWNWLARESSLLDDERGRSLLQQLETNDWDRAAKIWGQAESSLWATRCATAAFHLRKFQGEREPDIKDLARAHELHPGSFAIARVYVGELLKAGKPAAARKVLQEVISGFASVEDRRSAREMLVSLQASPVLPKQG